MSITAIVYTSNTGFTERYAKMLGEKLNLPVYNLKGKTQPIGNEIIYFGWLFASNIKGYKQAAKRYKIAAVCGVGLGNTGSQTGEVRKTAKLPDTIPLFTLQGGMKREELQGINKFMINMLEKMLASKERTAEESQMLELIKLGGDYVNEENLAEVINWYKV